MTYITRKSFTLKYVCSTSVTPDLVFGVGGVYPLAVFAGLKQDMDGIELQENLTGHAVKEGDVGQGCGRKEEHLTTGGALT